MQVCGDLPLSGKSRDDAQHVMLSAAKHLLQILRLAQNDDCFIADADIARFYPKDLKDFKVFGIFWRIMRHTEHIFRPIRRLSVIKNSRFVEKIALKTLYFIPLRKLDSG